MLPQLVIIMNCVFVPRNWTAIYIMLEYIRNIPMGIIARVAVYILWRKNINQPEHLCGNQELSSCIQRKIQYCSLPMLSWGLVTIQEHFNELWWHGYLCPNRLRLASTERWSAYKSYACIYQLVCHAHTRGCRHHNTSSCYHWLCPHLRVLWTWGEEGFREGNVRSWGKKVPRTSGREFGVRS